MTKHLAQAGLGVLSLAFRTTLNVEWYVLRRTKSGLASSQAMTIRSDQVIGSVRADPGRAGIGRA